MSLEKGKFSVVTLKGPGDLFEKSFSVYYRHRAEPAFKDSWGKRKVGVWEVRFRRVEEIGNEYMPRETRAYDVVDLRSSWAYVSNSVYFALHCRINKQPQNKELTLSLGYSMIYAFLAAKYNGPSEPLSFLVSLMRSYIALAWMCISHLVHLPWDLSPSPLLSES